MSSEQRKGAPLAKTLIAKFSIAKFSIAAAILSAPSRCAWPRPVATLLLALALLIGADAPARSQAASPNPFSVAIRINDEVISHYDLAQRIKLVTLASAGREKNPKDRAVSELIDEALKLQEAERLGIKATDEALEKALEQLAKNNRMPSKDALLATLKKNGIDETHFRRQVRSEMVWREVLGRRFGNRMKPSEDEVDAAFKAAESSAVTVYDVRQIVVPVAPTAPVPKVRQAFERAMSIRGSLKSCAALMKVAPNFPPYSGPVGILAAQQMPAPIRAIVLKLKPGRVAERPIRSQQGFHLIMLCGTQKRTASRERVTQALVAERAGRMSKSYLADLKRAAVIDTNL